MYVLLIVVCPFVLFLLSCLFFFDIWIMVAQWVRSLDLTAHTSLSPIRHGFAPSFVNYKKGCTRLAAASDKVYQLLAQGWWFYPGTPASSTTKTGRHDIAEILLKVALKHQKSNHLLRYTDSDCPFGIFKLFLHYFSCSSWESWDFYQYTFRHA